MTLCVDKVRMNFTPNFAVYVCPHVFDNSRPVLSSVRDHDGDWQFLCGQEDCVSTSEPKLIGAGHLTAVDSTIEELTVLDPGSYAERTAPNTPWRFGRLDES